MNKAYKAALLDKMIKGGPGSGNHGHAGIQGHQGGSKPTDGVANKKPSEAQKPWWHTEGWSPERVAEMDAGMARLQAIVDANPPKNPAVLEVINRKTPKVAAPKKPATNALVDAMTPKVATKPKDDLAALRVPTDDAAPASDAISKNKWDEDPLVVMFGGDPNEELYDDDMFDTKAERTKYDLVGRLANKTKLPPEQVNDFVHQWAVSSNDSDMRSLSVQAEAAKVFGTKLTPWQNEAVAKVQKERQAFLARHLDGPGPDDGIAAALKMAKDMTAQRTGAPYLFEAEFLKEWVNENKHRPVSRAELKKILPSIQKRSEEQIQKLLTATYDETQRQLKAAGITEVKLFRGAVVNATQGAAMREGQAVEVESNALSSWTLHNRTALDFANGEWNGEKVVGGTGVVYDAVVPASRIYSTAVSGQGALDEFEMVVIGKPHDKVRVWRRVTVGGSRSNYKSILSTMIKGGPGSGNHGHAGIPGHQGGSKPTGSADSSSDRPYVKGRKIKVEDLDIFNQDASELRSNRYSRDKVLSSVIKAQGFDGLPTKVEPTEFDRLLAEGEITHDLYRGVFSGQEDVAQSYREDFADGLFFVGEGTPANGVYVTTERHFALGYAKGKEDGLLRMGFKKDAKIIPYPELESKRAEIVGSGTRSDRDKAAWLTYSSKQQDLMDKMNAAVEAKDTKAARGFEEQLYQTQMHHQNNYPERIANDPGRVAAFLGYDAIQVDENVFVILNRTALYVEDPK